MTKTNSAAILPRADGATIAYHKLNGRGPGIIFLGGFRSDMTGTKAQALEAHCRKAGYPFVRFDYFGHGESSGKFTEGTIGRWVEDTITVLDEIAEGPQILVGSSMGGWIMLLTTLARPDRIAGLIGIAPAPDFTEMLIWQRYSDDARETLQRDGVFFERSPYGEQPYPITLKLIEEGRQHLLLDRAIDISCPVHLLHGMQDDAVPWQHSLKISKNIASEKVVISYIKDGDHRLSREEDLDHLIRTVDNLYEQLG